MVAGSEVGDDSGSSPLQGCVVYGIILAALIVWAFARAGSALLRRRGRDDAGISQGPAWGPGSGARCVLWSRRGRRG